MKKLIKFLMMTSLVALCLGSYTAFAEESNQIDIQMQLNNENITINGSKLTVEKPFLSNDTTLVPLRVITTAFGATLNWDSPTQKITLKYGDQTIQLTVGSNTAIVNGKTIELSSPPQIVNGTTMVPIRFISENFGANVGFDSETSSLTIKGTKKKTNASDTLNSDFGKTRIGNSYYGWSMNYPSGLSKKDQSFKEETVLFKDAQGEYSLFITVEDLSQTLSEDGILKKLADGVSGTILDKTYVNQGTNSYAKIVAKNNDLYKEYRAFVNSDKFYVIVLVVNKEADYKNQLKYQSYMDLLNSFSPSFDAQDQQLKDLSTVTNGFRNYTNDDFGLSLNIPSTWIKGDSKRTIDFYDKKSNAGISIRITSIVDNDTLDAWVGREQKQITSHFLPDYVKISPPTDLVVADTPAKLLKYSNRFSENWSNFYGVYLFKDNLKYEIDFMQDKKEVNEKLVYDVLNSIKFNKDKINSSLGNIKDDLDFVDRTKRTTITKKDAHYSIAIPDFWREHNTKGDDQLSYSFVNGNFSVLASDNMNLDRLIKLTEAALEKKKDTATNYKMVDKGSETIAGVQANKYIYEENINGVDLRTSLYIFKSGDFVYEIIAMNSFATSTEENNKIIADTIKSMKIID